MTTAKTEGGRIDEGTAIPPEYSHLPGEDLTEAMECERSNDMEYLKKVRRTFLFENRLDTFKRLARKGKLDEELESDAQSCIDHARWCISQGWWCKEAWNHAVCYKLLGVYTD